MKQSMLVISSLLKYTCFGMIALGTLFSPYISHYVGSTINPNSKGKDAVDFEVVVEGALVSGAMIILAVATTGFVSYQIDRRL